MNFNELLDTKSITKTKSAKIKEVTITNIELL